MKDIVIGIVVAAFILITYGVVMAYFNCHGNPDYPLKSPFSMTCDGPK